MSDRETLSCQQAVDRVYEYLDGELDAETTERVRAHLEVCKKCYPYFNFERIFLDHIRSRSLGSEQNERLEQRVLDALSNLELE